jgi:N4-gp56 family major capsid protein
MTTATLSPRAAAFYSKLYIEALGPKLVYGRHGVKENMKPNSGKKIDFQKYEDLPAATTQLSEGVTPVGMSIIKRPVTADIAQYGSWTGISDVVELVSLDPEVTKIVEKLGKQSGLTMDTVLRDSLLAGTNEFYAGSVLSRDSVTSNLTDTDFKKIVRTLKRANVEEITAMIDPSTGISTVPVAPSYICIGHTDLEMSLRALESSGFIPIEKYPSQRKVFEGEVGAGWGIRFILTTNAPIIAGAGGTATSGVKATGGKTDIYQTIIFGQDAYAEVPLNKGSTGIILKLHSKSDTSDTSDPLNQRSTAGWKAMYASLILDDDRLVRYEHGVLA